MARACVLNHAPEVGAAVGRGAWADVRKYLRYVRPKADADYNNSDFYGLAAISLRHEPVAWPLLLGLAHLTDPGPTADPTFRDDLKLNTASLTLEQSAVLGRIGRHSSAGLGILELRDTFDDARVFVFQDGEFHRGLVEGTHDECNAIAASLGATVRWQAPDAS